MRGTYSFRRFSGIAALLFLGACGSNGNEPGEEAPGQQTKEITDYLAQVAFAREYDDHYVIATHQTGEPPPVVVAYNRVHVTRPGATYIPGGSTPITIGPSGHMWITGVVKVSGAGGYFEFTRADGCDCVGTLAPTIRQDVPSAFVLQVASPGSPFDELPVQLTQVGIGDIQVNLSWDLNSGIDLHVVEPSGEEIYPANSGPSSAGGQLDFGPGSDCSIDGPVSENIFWPTGRAKCLFNPVDIFLLG